MSQQTSMLTQPIVAYEGQVSQRYVMEFVTAKIATAGVYAGRALSWLTGFAVDQVALPAASGDVTGNGFVGFSCYDPSKMVAWPAGNVYPYPIGEDVKIIRKGAIWLMCEQAVTITDTVYVNYAVVSSSTIGRVRKDNNGGSGAAAGQGMTFLSIVASATNAAPSLVLVGINL